MRAALGWVWVVAIACVSPENPELASPSGARTLLLIVETAHRGLRAEVHDLEAGPLATPLTVELGDAYYALFYAESPASLGLEAIELTLMPCSDGVPSRPLPDPVLARGRRIEDGGSVAIADADVAALFRRVWIDPGERCAAGGWQRLDGAVDVCPATWAIEVAPPEPPEPPELPRACDACDAPGFEPRRACGPFEAHFLGQNGCTSIGRVCPAVDVWPALPAGTLWVVAGATGVGTEADPSGDLEAIVASAPDGATIAIAGELLLARPIDVERSLTIRGLCPERSRIAGELHAVAPLRLEDLAIGGGSRAIRADLAPVELAGVLVDGEGSGLVAISAHAADLRIADSAIRDWRDAVQVDLGSARIDRSNFTGSLFSVTASAAAVHLDSVVIENERERSELGWGIHLLAGSTADLRRLSLDGIWGRGLIGASGARIDAADLSFREVSGFEPVAIHLGSSTLTSTRVAIDMYAYEAVLLEGSAVARFADLNVDSEGASEQLDGIFAIDGARLSLERARLRGARFKDAIHLTSSAPEPHVLRDVEIDGVDRRAAMVASAIHVSNGSMILQRASIHDWGERGIDLNQQASLEASDLELRAIAATGFEITPLVLSRQTKIQRALIIDIPTAIRFSSGTIALEDLEVRACGRGFKRYLSYEYLDLEVDRFALEVTEVGFDLGDLGNAPMHFANGSTVVSRVGEIVRYAAACEPHPELFELVGAKITPQ